jgi:hypothetical protein
VPCDSKNKEQNKLLIANNNFFMEAISAGKIKFSHLSEK